MNTINWLITAQEWQVNQEIEIEEKARQWLFREVMVSELNLIVQWSSTALASKD